MTSRMTATDELRRLLDERGKEHRVWPSGLVIWHDEGSWVYEYSPPKGDDDYWGGILHATLRHCTPEQAVEATLGSDLKAENEKLRELVRDLWLAGSLCDAIPAMRLQAKGGDWRTMQERVDEALGIEVDV